ncbi:hypothetical protein SEUCBS139899_009367 [Sporothrix eucalyptigena]
MATTSSTSSIYATAYTSAYTNTHSYSGRLGYNHYRSSTNNSSHSSASFASFTSNGSASDRITQNIEQVLSTRPRCIRGPDGNLVNLPPNVMPRVTANSQNCSAQAQEHQMQQTQAHTQQIQLDTPQQTHLTHSQPTQQVNDPSPALQYPWSEYNNPVLKPLLRFLPPAAIGILDREPREARSNDGTKAMIPSKDKACATSVFALKAAEATARRMERLSARRDAQLAPWKAEAAATTFAQRTLASYEATLHNPCLSSVAHSHTVLSSQKFLGLPWSLCGWRRLAPEAKAAYLNEYAKIIRKMYHELLGACHSDDTCTICTHCQTCQTCFVCACECAGCDAEQRSEEVRAHIQRNLHNYDDDDDDDNDDDDGPQLYKGMKVAFSSPQDLPAPRPEMVQHRRHRLARRMPAPLHPSSSPSLSPLPSPEPSPMPDLPGSVLEQPLDTVPILYAVIEDAPWVATMMHYDTGRAWLEDHLVHRVEERRAECFDEELLYFPGFEYYRKVQRMGEERPRWLAFHTQRTSKFQQEMEEDRQRHEENMRYLQQRTVEEEGKSSENQEEGQGYGQGDGQENRQEDGQEDVQQNGQEDGAEEDSGDGPGNNLGDGSGGEVSDQDSEEVTLVNVEDEEGEEEGEEENEEEDSGDNSDDNDGDSNANTPVVVVLVVSESGSEGSSEDSEKISLQTPVNLAVPEDILGSLLDSSSDSPLNSPQPPVIDHSTSNSGHGSYVCFCPFHNNPTFQGRCRILFCQCPHDPINAHLRREIVLSNAEQISPETPASVIDRERQQWIAEDARRTADEALSFFESEQFRLLVEKQNQEIADAIEAWPKLLNPQAFPVFVDKVDDAGDGEDAKNVDASNDEDSDNVANVGDGANTKPVENENVENDADVDNLNSSFHVEYGDIVENVNNDDSSIHVEHVENFDVNNADNDNSYGTQSRSDLARAKLMHQLIPRQHQAQQYREFWPEDAQDVLLDKYDNPATLRELARTSMPIGPLPHERVQWEVKCCPQAWPAMAHQAHEHIFASKWGLWWYYSPDFQSYAQQCAIEAAYRPPSSTELHNWADYDLLPMHLQEAYKSFLASQTHLRRSQPWQALPPEQRTVREFLRFQGLRLSTVRTRPPRRTLRNPVAVSSRSVPLNPGATAFFPFGDLLVAAPTVPDPVPTQTLVYGMCPLPPPAPEPGLAAITPVPQTPDLESEPEPVSEPEQARASTSPAGPATPENSNPENNVPDAREVSALLQNPQGLGGDAIHLEGQEDVEAMVRETYLVDYKDRNGLP